MAALFDAGVYLFSGEPDPQLIPGKDVVSYDTVKRPWEHSGVRFEWGSWSMLPIRKFPEEPESRSRDLRDQKMKGFALFQDDEEFVPLTVWECELTLRRRDNTLLPVNATQRIIVSPEMFNHVILAGCRATLKLCKEKCLRFNGYNASPSRLAAAADGTHVLAYFHLMGTMDVSENLVRSNFADGPAAAL
jgi:hypothetical protein